MVTMVVAQPSCRSCYQVGSFQTERKRGPRKSRCEMCLCFGTKCCTCEDYENNVVLNKTSLTVKHLHSNLFDIYYMFILHVLLFIYVCLFILV